jgi:hypothetical protein
MYPAEVLEIHKAFNNAGEQILREAEQKRSERKPINTFKINLLKKLGFNQVSEVTEHDKVVSDIEMSDKLVDKIHQYKVKYPNHKFITPKQVTEICKKWNLVEATIDKYKGFVPEKNLMEISRFNDKYIPKDALILNNIITTDYEVRNVGDWYHIYKKGYLRKKGDSDQYFLQSEDGVRFYGHIRHKHLDLFGPLIDLIKTDETVVHFRDDRDFILNIMKKESPYKICAPIKDMDTKGMRLFGTKLVNYPDPVVLFPVEMGYIIVTAWGDEASDENVVNQNFN